MKFTDKKEEFIYTIESVCLFISLGGVFFQIWILISGIEAYLRGNYAVLFPMMILSGLVFLSCGAGVFLTNIDFLKGITEGRTKTYQNEIF